MSRERYQCIMKIFNTAVQSPTDERGLYLDKVCEGDFELRKDVESLLEADANPRCFLDTPILGTGFNVSQFVAVTPALTAATPEQIGPYRILGVLGTGGMGIVYLAEQRKPQRLVALKMIRPDKTSQRLHQRFIREIELLGRLRHPGIARIYDAGSANTPNGSRPYIVMELIEGLPLLEFVSTQQLNKKQCLELLTCICDAVSYAHKSGVIHRDLKPANILVEYHNGCMQPKILDFGIACLTHHDIPNISYTTETGQPLGTLAYMSPEQVCGVSNNIDVRSDVYSLAVIGFELLTGKHPIDVTGKSVFAAMEEIRKKTATQLSAFNRRFRGDLSTLFAKALAKDKELRYASTGHFSSDIRRYLEHKPITGRKSNLLYRLRKFARCNWRTVLVVFISISIFCYSLRWNRNAQYQEDQEKQAFNEFVGDTAEKLNRISGISALNREMLQRTRGQIETQLARYEDNITLKSKHADVLTLISDIDLDQKDSDSAFELRKQVLEIREHLITVDPVNSNRLADLSVAKVKIGDVYQSRKQLAIAEIWYTEALLIDEQLVHDQPDSMRFLSNLAWSYSRMGALALKSNRWDQSVIFLDRSFKAHEKQLSLDPSNPDAWHGKREVEGLRAQLAEMEGRHEDDQSHTQNAIDYARQAAELEPSNRLYLTALSSAQTRMARYLFSHNRLMEADEMLAEACVVIDRQNLLDPDDLANRLVMLKSLEYRCIIATKRGHPETVLSQSERAIKIAERLCLDKSRNVDYLQRLVRMLKYAQQSSSTLGLNGKAKRYWSEMGEILHELADRENPQPDDLQCYANYLLMSPLIRPVDLVKARLLAQQAVNLTNGNKASCWEVLSRVYEQLDEPDKAIESLRTAYSMIGEDEQELRTSIVKRLSKLHAVQQLDTEK